MSDVSFQIFRFSDFSFFYCQRPTLLLSTGRSIPIMRSIRFTLNVTGATTMIVLWALSTPSAFATASQATVVAVRGSVTSAPSPSAAFAPVVKGNAITVGSAIKTADASELLMSPFQGSAIRVLEESSLVLSESDLQKSGETVLGRKAVLDLHRGSVQVALDKRPGGPVDLKVGTPQCVAAARGTVFQTSTSGHCETQIIVLRGEVLVSWTDANQLKHEEVVKPGMKRTISCKRVESIYETATAAELASLAAFENEAASAGLVDVANLGPSHAPLLVDPPVLSIGTINPINISGGVVSPEQPPRP